MPAITHDPTEPLPIIGVAEAFQIVLELAQGGMLTDKYAVGSDTLEAEQRRLCRQGGKGALLVLPPR